MKLDVLDLTIVSALHQIEYKRGIKSRFQLNLTCTLQVLAFQKT